MGLSQAVRHLVRVVELSHGFFRVFFPFIQDLEDMVLQGLFLFFADIREWEAIVAEGRRVAVIGFQAACHGGPGPGHVHAGR